MLRKGLDFGGNRKQFRGGLLEVCRLSIPSQVHTWYKIIVGLQTCIRRMSGVTRVGCNMKPFLYKCPQ